MPDAPTILRPTPTPQGDAVQVFIGTQDAGGFDSPMLWLAKEWAQTLARNEPGAIAWVFEDGSLSETYRFDPEDGMQRGVAR